MKVKVVTSFNAPLWQKYTSKCVGSWVEHLNLTEGSQIEIWINGAFPGGLPMKTKSGTEIVYKSLDAQSDGWKHFFDTFRNHPVPEVPSNQQFRFNFIPFSCKVYALAEATSLVYDAREAKEMGAPKGPTFDTLLWLDADVLLKKSLTSADLSDIIGNNHFAWLDRGDAWSDVGETGFMLAKTSGQVLDIFLHQANIYGSGQLFYMREWHDAFVLSSCIRYKEFTDTQDFQVKNLNEDMEAKHKQGLYPFETSVLNQWMDHYKGHLKDNLVNT